MCLRSFYNSKEIKVDFKNIVYDFLITVNVPGLIGRDDVPSSKAYPSGREISPCISEGTPTVRRILSAHLSQNESILP